MKTQATYTNVEKTINTASIVVLTLMSLLCVILCLLLIIFTTDLTGKLGAAVVGVFFFCSMVNGFLNMARE